MKKSPFNSEISEDIYEQIRQVLLNARAKVLTTVNTAMVQAYWSVGKLIVEAQGRVERTPYVDDLIKKISQNLTTEFGKGFTPDNLRRMRQFYLCSPNCGTVCHNLSWSHIRKLIKVTNPKAREYYARKA